MLEYIAFNGLHKIINSSNDTCDFLGSSIYLIFISVVLGLNHKSTQKVYSAQLGVLTCAVSYCHLVVKVLVSLICCEASVVVEIFELEISNPLQNIMKQQEKVSF